MSRVLSQEVMVLKDERPRMGMVDLANLTDDQARVLSSAPMVNGKTLNIYRMLAHHPRLLNQVMELGSSFQSGYLAAIDRELVILSVASACRSRYVFDGHVPIAAKTGLSGDQIRSIWERPSEPLLWSRHQIGLISFISELLSADSVDDVSLNGVAFYDDSKRMIELILLIGFYRMMAKLANVTRIASDEC